MFGQSKAFSSFSVDDLARARGFYGDTLGLQVDEQNGMLFLHLHDGADIVVYPKDDHTPATFTILNFSVDDIDEAVEELSGKGIDLIRYDQFPHDEKGVVREMGPPIGWFLDPAGNVLSVIETGR